MSELPGVSIVIPCYNHAQFVAFAIESALAQDHPRCEAIVVDDCSTDDSRRVIERFADRVRTVFLRSNRRQVAALNEAWPLAPHEIVIFLDSDDTLEPIAASTIARNWSPCIAKLQFPMKSIDADGRSLKHISPKYPAVVKTETLRQLLLAVGPVLLYSWQRKRVFQAVAERIAPIGGLQWMDTLLEIHAPFNGEVKTLTMPLACYRMHGSNWSQHNQLHVDRFASHLQYYEDKLKYLEFANSLGLAFDPQADRVAMVSERGASSSPVFGSATWSRADDSSAPRRAVQGHGGTGQPEARPENRTEDRFASLLSFLRCGAR